MKTSLVLMLLFISLGSFALYDHFYVREKKESSLEEATRLLLLKDKKLESIRISNSDSKFEFNCADSAGCAFDVNADWKLNAPVKDIADSATLGNFASSLLNLNTVERLDFDTTPDWKEFGLDKPEIELEVRAKGESEPYLVYFGKVGALGPTVYARTNKKPNQVVLVANYFTNILKKDLFYWRNKKLFPEVSAESITVLDWKVGGVVTRLEKLDGKWKLKKPVEAKANFILSEGLVSTMAYSAAKSIFTDDATKPAIKRFLTKRPKFEINFGTKESIHIVDLFEGPDPKLLIARIPGNKVLYNLDATPFDRFQKNISEYREPTILSNAEKNLVESIRLNFPREKKFISLKLNGANWIYDSGEKPTENLSQKRISEFLDSMSSKDAKFVSGPEAVLFSRLMPDVEVEFTGAGKLIHKSRFAINNRKLVLSEGELAGEVRILNVDFARALPIRFADLLESNNKQVVIKEEPKEDAHGHNHTD